MTHDKNSPTQWLIKEAFVGKESGTKYPAHVTRDLSYGSYEKDMIHVIEFKAYEAAQAKISELEYQVRKMDDWFYKNMDCNYLAAEGASFENTVNNLKAKNTKLQEAVNVLRAGHNAIISAKKSGCVEYKGCECWHQNASLALSKADAILGQGEK